MVAAGYTMLVPPGWARIPVGKGAREAIDTVLDRAFAAADGSGAAPLRREVHQELTRQVRAAAANHGVELYLPVERVHDITVPASVVVSSPPPPADPTDVLLALAARRRDAEVVDVAGRPAVRVESREPATTDTPARRQVQYYLAGEDRLLVVAATILQVGDDDAVAEAVTGLFDAMLTTFRWRGRGDR